MSDHDERPRSLEEFLAAPDSVRQNTEEFAKLQKRKARERAREEQLRAAKSDEEPTIEDMLSDIIRVAEDPVTNPWYEFRSMSRRRYELYGHYPIIFIDREFGQFNRALEAAGLRDEQGTRLWRAGRAVASKNAHVGRYVERYILPYVRKRPELQRDLDREVLMLSISDTHATFLDPFTWACFLMAIRDLKPEIVYLNGDILEGAEISSHVKIPGWTVPLAMEFEFQREMIRQVREEAKHEGVLVLGAGNHGLDRIARYLAQVASSLASLPSLRYDVLAGLDEFDVTLAQGGTIASPPGTEEHKAGMLLYGFYRIHHGTKLGATPAANELKAAGRSGQSGHVHRASLFYGANEATQGMSWMTTPMGCTERAGRAYIKGTTAGWQKGFGVAFLRPSGSVHQYPVVTDSDAAHVEGYVYHRSDLAPEKDPDPQTNWLLGNDREA